MTAVSWPSARSCASSSTSNASCRSAAVASERNLGSVAWVIDHDVLRRVLSTAMRSGGEFAEIYAEDKRSTSAGLDDGRVEQVNSGRDRGTGVRVRAGEPAGHAYTSDLSERGLGAAAEAAAAAARSGTGGNATVALTRAPKHEVNRVEVDPSGVPKSTKVQLLRRIDEAARSSNASVVQVSAS